MGNREKLLCARITERLDIDAYLTEIGVTSGRHKLLTMIEQLDEERGA